MVAAAASVTSKNQITIPKEIRKDMQINSGDKLMFRKKGNDWTIKRLPGDFVEYLKELGKGMKKNITLEELHKEFEEGWDDERWP